MNIITKIICLFIVLGGWLNRLQAQAPANDDCSNAETIVISNNGFGLGNFTSTQVNITNATVQIGENFAPAIFVAGLNDKSVWLKFSLPTIRAVRVTLSQPGTTIAAGDVGFAVYKDNNCLPTNDSISTKLTPIVTFGNTYHPCVPAGDYLVQVSSNTNANGPVIISVEISDQTGAAYDHPVNAYAFGVADIHTRSIDFETECQSIEDASEVCSVLNNYAAYHKSAWFTFTTPAYLDYLVVTLSGNTNTYFPGGGANILKKFGYNLYRGNAVTTPINNLVLVDGCDSMLTNGFRCATQQYGCGILQPGTTYSIQLFIHKDFSNIVRLGIITGGAAPAAGPLPINTLPTTNAIGVLPSSGSGTTTTVFDNFGCNSRHSVNSCSPSKPPAGVTLANIRYNLSTFFTFSLNRTVAILFRSSMVNCGPRPVIRLFKQTVTANCTSLDTVNIVGTASFNEEIECLGPGDYVMQVLGVDTPSAAFNSLDANDITNDEKCLFTNLGSRFQVQLIAYNRQAASRYSLNAPGKFDSINRVGNVQLPLADGVRYTANRDTFGCQPTLRPWDTTCSPLNDKVIYRQMIIADSGTVAFDDLIYSNNPPVRYKFYAGDANGLASAQNIFDFPNKVAGLVPNSLCMDGITYCQNKSACVVPGTYTFASIGNTGTVGWVDRPSFTFKKTRTKYNSLSNALDMGSIMDTLGANGGTIRAKRDYWDCSDNAIPINGYVPCSIGGRPATKAIYRQFYLKEDAILRFLCPEYGWWCVGQAHGTKTLFYGKATDGMAGLTPVGNQWNCFYNAGTSNNCAPLPAGWYTFVSWGTGPSYDSTLRLAGTGNRHNGYVSYFDEVDIIITPACPGPKFNRPYKASVTATNTPHLIQWGTTSLSTPVYPRTDTTFNLPVENFNCTVDTPFTSHPVVACEAASNRVAYYVFRTTQVSFLQINTDGYFASVYDKDVRTDSSLFASATPIHPCNSSLGNIQFCHFQPGTYTLVVFAKDANICRNISPTIFIDRVGYSRFDFANSAYDFGIIPPDSTYHFGKVGDVNPLHPSRPPSSDFIYCTTGAFSTDPTNGACNVTVNGNIYSNAINQPLYNDLFPQRSGSIARRNLWYTFVAEHPGTVRIKVENKTLQRGLQPKFAVYSSDVDASLPFSAVQSGGLVDSTVTDGLRFLTMNYINYWYCYHASNTISFYRDPCTARPTRYYIVVDNVNGIQNEQGGQLPNTQIDVSIQFDSFNLVLPKFDHYYQAYNIGTVGVGTFSGEQDNYSCATRRNDPLGNGQNGCTKTLWYKFTSTITGNVRYRIRTGANIYNNSDDIQLFQETIPGDSTSNSLKFQARSTVSSPTGAWAQSCVTAGTYYLLLPGCNAVNQYVIPEIEMIEQEGDFCSRAVSAAISGAGTATASVLVNCHTIGTDYGEFSPTLSCPQNGITTQYKTSWFRMDIGGTDTLDVTTYLVENTNASSSDIKYRMMTGDCGAMQEQSCVLDALTQNTYECLVPGQSYYIQVFTPVVKNNAPVTGTINLQIAAAAHADTCQPISNCLATANFLSSFDCTKDETVRFVNYSTFGNNISYQWDFGHNGAISTAVSPSYFYPALPVDSTYTIKLVVRNNACNKTDSAVRTLTVPARPYIDFGGDIIQCNSTAPVILRATSYPGSTYQWQNNSTADTFRIASAGNNTYHVKVTYNGCSSTDTVRVLISPLAPRPLKQIVLCTDSVLTDVRRGANETYLWNTGATTRSIYMSMQGYYWVDISYFDCVYRDSFEVVKPSNANPLGNDTTLCFSQHNYVLDAATNGATAYTWQNNSTADTFLVTGPGTYHVAVNFGNCSIRDTINIFGYPAPLLSQTDTTICHGETLLLPWGALVSSEGTYIDTLESSAGCDSLIQRYNVSLKAKPFIGNDTTVCFSAGPFILKAQTTGAIGYQWQDGSDADSLAVSTPGLYWVDVNFGTCRSRDSIIISGNSSPQLVITDTTVCSGSRYILPWGITANTTGTYTDTLVSLSGCDSLVRIVNLVVNNLQLLGADTSIEKCSGATVNLTTLYNTGGLTTAWTLGGITVANPVNIGTSGQYQLVVTNANGCTDTAEASIQFNPSPAVGNDATANICQGNSFNLQNVFTTTGLSTVWSFNNNNISDPAAVFTAGIYQLIASNGFNCADTAILTLSVSPKPTLGNDTAVRSCNNLNLTGLYNTGQLTTQWFLNNAIVNNPASVAATGNYQLIATSAAGCRDTAIVSYSLAPKPFAGNDSTINTCQGNVINLAALYNTSGLTTNWFINNSPVTNPSAVSAAGNYVLIVTNSFTCSDTAVITVTYSPKPNLGNDIVDSICQGNSYNLTTSFNAGGNTNSWTLNNETVLNPAAVTTAGQYQLISLTTAGCADTAQVNLSISGKPNLFITNPESVCLPNTVDLTNSSITNGSSAGLVFTYWQNVDATIAFSNPTTASDGTYFIKAANSAGCFEVKPVVVKSYPVQKVNAGNDKGICDSDSTATLSVTVSNNNAPVSYQWQPVDIGGIVNPNASSTLVKPSATPLQYIISITDGYGCNYIVNDTVIISKQPKVEVFAGNDTLVSTGVRHQLQATGGVTFEWHPPYLLDNPNIANPMATIYADSVLFTVIATDNFGCKGSDEILIKTLDGYTWYVPTAFSPNNDGRNDILRPIPVGIANTDYFRVFNRYGQLMFETNRYMAGWDGSYQGRPQPVGNYVWVLRGKGRNGRTIEMRGNVLLLR